MQQFQEKMPAKRTKQRMSYEDEQKQQKDKKPKRINKRQTLEMQGNIA